MLATPSTFPAPPHAPQTQALTRSCVYAGSPDHPGPPYPLLSHQLRPAAAPAHDRGRYSGARVPHGHACSEGRQSAAEAPSRGPSPGSRLGRRWLSFVLGTILQRKVKKFFSEGDGKAAFSPGVFVRIHTKSNPNNNGPVLLVLRSNAIDQHPAQDLGHVRCVS